MNGKLFNIDGIGSRVAPVIYGPRQVIVVVVMNKLVDTVEDAIEPQDKLQHHWMRKGLIKIRHV